jgi:hypothetical protein
VNISFRPKNWTKWTKRNFSTSHHYYQEHKSHSATNKGKVHKIHKWKWSAGAGWTILSILDWWLLAAGGWLSWQGVFFRWTPIGICIIAATQWHLHNKECTRNGLPRTAPAWQVIFKTLTFPYHHHLNFHFHFRLTFIALYHSG